MTFLSPQKEKSLDPLKIKAFLLAEKEGFEPSRPFWGLHDFQSCALDQTTRLLRVCSVTMTCFEILPWGTQQ